jgi:hypothetical protein
MLEYLLIILSALAAYGAVYFALAAARERFPAVAAFEQRVEDAFTRPKRHEQRPISTTSTGFNLTATAVNLKATQF